MTTVTATALAQSPDRPSAYDLRVYHVAEEELETLERVLRELALPMMPDHGMEAIEVWADRGSNMLYQISRHDSLDAIKGNWDRLHADPRWQAGLKALRQDRIVVKAVRTTLLTGIAGLPPFAGATVA